MTANRPASHRKTLYLSIVMIISYISLAEHITNYKTAAWDLWTYLWCWITSSFLCLQVLSVFVFPNQSLIWSLSRLQFTCDVPRSQNRLASVLCFTSISITQGKAIMKTSLFKQHCEQELNVDHLSGMLKLLQVQPSLFHNLVKTHFTPCCFQNSRKQKQAMQVKPITVKCPRSVQTSWGRSYPLFLIVD